MAKLPKTLSTAAAGVGFALAAAAPASASLDLLSADELAQEFGKGSLVCEWTSADGKIKGEDFYYKNRTAWSGDADRNLGDDTVPGSWKILGKGFWTRFDADNKAIGTWTNLEKVDDKTYKAYDSSQKLVRTMTCK